MKRVGIWLVASIWTVVLAAGEVLPGRYIVELTGEPALAAGQYSKREARRAMIAARRGAVREQHRQMRRQFERQHATVTDEIENVANALIVSASDESIERLRRLRGVKRVHPVRMRYLMMDRATGVVRASDAWAMLGGSQFAGKGMRIGIIDTGIDASHPAFQDPELTLPEGYPQVNKWQDRDYTNTKVIVARNYDRREVSTARDTKGHGTAVAMVAAGVPNAGPNGVITGIAPKAQLGSYKVFPDNLTGAPDDQILKAIDDAIGDGMDVINLSLGSLFAEKPDIDPLVQGVERASAAGVIVVVAAGNDGPDPNTVGSPATAPNAITVGNSANDRVFASSVAVEGLGSMTAMPGDLSSSLAPLNGPLADVSTLDSDGLACGTLPAASLQGRVVLILRGICTFEEKLRNAQTAGATAAIVYTDAARPQPIGMTVGTSRLPAVMVGYADGVRLKERIAASPGVTAALNFIPAALPTTQWALSGSSSRGPFASSIKPDVVAVGTEVSTAYPVRLGSYRVINGTSFSSPMVAGAAALLKAARPGLRAAQYRSLLINSATAFTDGTFPVRLQQTGAGLLNVAAAIKAPLTSEPAALSYGIGDGNLDTWQTLALTNVSGTNDRYTIQVVPINGSVAPVPVETSFELAKGATTWVPMVIQQASLQPGEYQGYVNITSQTTGEQIRVPYWYGVPSVAAKRITLLNPFETTRTPGSRQFIIFRATDEAGLPVLTTTPEVTVPEDSEARVVAVDNEDAEIPGAFVATVRLSPTAGINRFTIKSGDATLEVSIEGR